MKINKIEIRFPFKVKIKEHDLQSIRFLLAFLSGFDCAKARESGDASCVIFLIRRETPFELLSQYQNYLIDVVNRICDYNCQPGHVMWPSGSGQKPIDIDKGLWEETTFHINVACREAHKGEKQSSSERECFKIKGVTNPSFFSYPRNDQQADHGGYMKELESISNGNHTQLDSTPPEGSKAVSSFTMEAEVENKPQELKIVRSFYAMTKSIPSTLKPEAQIVMQALFDCFERQKEVKEGKFDDLVFGFEQAGIPGPATVMGVKYLFEAGYVKFQGPDNAFYTELTKNNVGIVWVRYQPKLLDLVYEGA